MSGKIDDPTDVSFDALSEQREGPGEKFGELAINFSGLIFPPAAILKILTDQFLPANRFKRIDYLFRAMSLGFRGLESRLSTEREKIKEIQARIQDRAACKSHIGSTHRRCTPASLSNARVSCGMTFSASFAISPAVARCRPFGDRDADEVKR